MPHDNEKNKKKNKKKEKKRLGAAASRGPPQNTRQVKPQAVSLHPETMSLSLLPPHHPNQPQLLLPKQRPVCKKDGEQLVSSAWRSKKQPKNVVVLSIQASESLRWEGVLEDPQAEEKRLELYRANRRQRYMAHREALLKEKQTEHREDQRFCL